MQTVKNIERIQTQLCDGKPLWICLDSSVISQMAIGWVSRLASNNMIGIPTEQDMKNHAEMARNTKDQERE
jgi:hypothetical protein